MIDSSSLEYPNADFEFFSPLQLYRELIGTGDLDAKSKYVHLCRGLNTYGVTFFLVKGTVDSFITVAIDR